jgi:hypothetical protein
MIKILVFFLGGGVQMKISLPKVTSTTMTQKKMPRSSLRTKDRGILEQCMGRTDINIKIAD